MDEENRLGGLSPIERVITQEEVKLYRVKADLAYLDGSTEVLFQPPIPVYSDDCRHLGYAVVSTIAQGSRIVGELTIDYACEERLLLETRAVTLYARLVGFFSVGNPTTALHITKIVISRQIPNDPRLQTPLGAVIL